MTDDDRRGAVWARFEAYRSAEAVAAYKASVAYLLDRVERHGKLVARPLRWDTLGVLGDVDDVEADS